MRKISKKLLASLVLFTLVSGSMISAPNKVYAATSPSLGNAASFSVLAETTITNVPTSVVSGDVGLSPAAGSFIGLTNPEVAGTIYSVDASGPLGRVTNPVLLGNAISDMMAVFTDNTPTGINQACDIGAPFGFGGGVVDLFLSSPLLVPGVYCADAFIMTGNVVLSPGVYIFKSAATLTVSANFSITSGDACDVWWRVATSADLGVGSAVMGNILAGTSINMQTGASLQGRALAQAAVTLDSNTISGCATPTPNAALTINKIVINDNNGDSVVADFPLFVGVTAVVSGALNTFAPNTYVVSETNVSGYTSSFSGDCNANGSITLVDGDTKTCTITNNDIEPSSSSGSRRSSVVPPSSTTLTVTKIVINDNGGTKVVSDFPLFVGATGVTSGIENNFASGTYTISETNTAGYVSTFGGDCALNGVVTLLSGDDKTCTITNNDIPFSAPIATPGLPSTGVGPNNTNIPLIIISFGILSSVFLYLARKKKFI